VAVAGLAVIWVVWPRTAAPRVTRDGAPSWSPDGRRIAYFSEQANGHADLFVMDAGGGNRRALTGTPGADEGAPAFSPDGRQIAYDTDLDGDFEIYVMDAAGGGARRLTRHPGRDLSPAWSPDGARIAFMSDRAGQGFDVYSMRADGSDVERLTTTGSSWFPQYSPDGRTIAMHVHRDVHLLDLPARTLTRLTTDPENGMYPSWSPAGRLAFMSWRRGRTELFTMDADGARQELLLSMPAGGAIDPRWSPDGARIVFVHVPEGRPDEPQSPDHERAIHVIEVETGQLRRLSR
jgi:TolB protein